MANKMFKPNITPRERCYQCGSYNLAVNESRYKWACLVCKDCGSHVKDYGD